MLGGLHGSNSYRLRQSTALPFDRKPGALHRWLAAGLSAFAIARAMRFTARFAGSASQNVLESSRGAGFCWSRISATLAGHWTTVTGAGPAVACSGVALSGLRTTVTTSEGALARARLAVAAVGSEVDGRQPSGPGLE